MRKALFLSVCLLTAAPASRAQVLLLCTGDYPNGTCQLTQAGFQQLYVYEAYALEGATAVRFTFDVTNAPGTTLLGFESTFPHSGQLGGEISVSYGACLYSEILVGSVYLVADCGYLRFSSAASKTCLSAERVMSSWPLCVCEKTFLCFVLATEASTWGAVKALYR
jgi:hypothetical protein